MEQFILHGKYQDVNKKLQIPTKKIFDVNDKFILRGKNQNISCDQGLLDEDYPYRPPVNLRTVLLDFAAHDQMFKRAKVVNPNILDHIYSKHGYPLAQGPAVPLIDQVK